MNTTLLGIIDFLFIENQESSGSDWIQIFVTALLSGLVAWSAAFLQNKYQQYNEYIKEYERNKYILNTINIYKVNVLKELQSFHDNEKIETEKINPHSIFEIKFTKENLNHINIINSFSHREIYDSLKFFSYSNLINDYVHFYFRISKINELHKELLQLYNSKIEEYNKMADSIENVLQDVVIELQKFIFTSELSKRYQTFNNLELEHYKREDKDIKFLYDLDKIFFDFKNLDRKNYFLQIKSIMESIIKLVNQDKRKIYLEISTVQMIANVISKCVSIEEFVSSYIDSKKSYIEVLKFSMEKTQIIIDNELKIPKKLTFFQYLISKKS